MGGLEAISGSTVTLYAAGNTGYGSPPVKLGSTTSSALGSFAISYAKPPAVGLLYLVASGGNAGFGVNHAIMLMTAPGLSNALPPGSITINELTTIAAAWPTVRFINPAAVPNVGASSTNFIGLANSLAPAKNLVNVNTGQVSTFLPGAAQCAGASPPANCVTERKLDLLADILAACVHSAGPSASFPNDCPSISGSSPACDRLFCYAKATNTLTAAVNIALNPLVVSPLSHQSLPFNLANSASPFQPIPSSTPNDLTLGLNYAVDFGPNFVALDAAGNAWITEGNAVAKLSPGGKLLSPAGGYTGGGLGAANGIAIDSAANVWVANGANNVTELNSSGKPTSPSTGYFNASTRFCGSIAIDKSAHVWVTNRDSSSIAELSSTGSFISPSTGFTGGGLNSPHGIAIDGSGNVWAGNGPSANPAFGSVTKLTSAGSPLSPAGGFTGGGLKGTHGVAIDSSGNLWAANRSGASLSKVNSSGTPLSPSTGFTGGGLSGPNGVAIDSLGRVFAANQGANTLSELNSAGAALSPVTGFRGPGVTVTKDVAIDASGNVWTTNNSASNVLEFFGLAAPVKTPLSGLPKLP